MIRTGFVLPLRSALLLLVPLLWVAATHAAEADHPLLTRYPGSKITSHDARDFGSYRMIVGLTVKGMEFASEQLEGKVTRIVYENPTDRSTLEIFRNYKEALAKAGAEVVFACEMDECGPAYARSAWNQQNGLFAASDGDPRYLAARVTSGGSRAYVAVMTGKRRTQVDVVEVKAMDTGLVAVDVGALAKGIEQEGSVRVYGILFDFDKATIRPESKPTLEAIAELLRGQKDLSLFVVGHTDGVGSVEHNMTLSRARAQAVVQALINDYRIVATRLEAHGVGPLAPVATNATDKGRQLNRRVELVKRGT